MRASAWIVFLSSLLVSGPALATDFYVAINSGTDSCHIVLEEPDGDVMLPLGGPYTSYDEATEKMKTLEECGEEGSYR
jgi:hypothetical protein